MTGWHNLFSHLSWLSLALYSVGLYGLLVALYHGIFRVWLPLKRQTAISSNEFGFWKQVSAHLANTRRVRRLTTLSTTAFIGIFGFGCTGIGFVIGYQTRSVVQASLTDTWTNVHIAHSFGNNRFDAYVDGSPTLTHFRLCPDSSYAQFEPGSWLKFMTFERRRDCLSFAGNNLGFQSLWDTHGNPIITEVTLDEPRR